MTKRERILSLIFLCLATFAAAPALAKGGGAIQDIVFDMLIKLGLIDSTGTPIVGAATQTLAETLVLGNVTDVTDIVLSTGTDLTAVAELDIIAINEINMESGVGNWDINLQPGAGSASKGGDVNMVAGAGDAANPGGQILAFSGQGGPTGAGGNWIGISGAGGATSGNSGAFTIDVGPVTSGTPGTIGIGITNALTLLIGNASSTTTIQGTVIVGTSGQTVTFPGTTNVTTLNGALTALSVTSPLVNVTGTAAQTLITEHATAPGTPSAATVSFYAKADGLLYSKDDAGVETLMSGGSSGNLAAVLASGNTTGVTDIVLSSGTDLTGAAELDLTAVGTISIGVIATQGQLQLATTGVVIIAAAKQILGLNAGAGSGGIIGGTVSVLGGAGDVASAGGNALFAGGASGSSSAAGIATVRGGDAIGSGNSGGNFIARGGDGTGGTAGSASLDAGAVGGGTGAAVTIGGIDAISVALGKSGAPTTTLGTHNFDEAVTMDTTLGVTGVATAASFALAGNPTWSSGTGTPEAAVTAVIGSIFSQTDGTTDTALWRKESGAGNTGWVAIAAGGGAAETLQQTVDAGATSTTAVTLSGANLLGATGVLTQILGTANFDEDVTMDAALVVTGDVRTNGMVSGTHGGASPSAAGNIDLYSAGGIKKGTLLAASGSWNASAQGQLIFHSSNTLGSGTDDLFLSRSTTGVLKIGLTSLNSDGTFQAAGLGARLAVSDVATTDTVVTGMDAVASASASNTTGGNLVLWGGIGTRFLTIIDFTQVGDVITVTVNGVDTVLVENVDFNGETSNAVTATNLAAAIDAIDDLVSFAISASVIVLPGVGAYEVVLAETGVLATVTNGTDGTVTSIQFTAKEIHGNAISTIVDNTATVFVTVNLDDGEIAGGTIEGSVHVTDGTDHQALTTLATWSAVRKGSTVTATIMSSGGDDALAASSGTLVTVGGSNGFTVTTTSTSVSLLMDANTSLTPTLMEFHFLMVNLHDSSVTFP